MWEHPVFPVHTTEVAPCESSHPGHCQTGVAQVCVWQEVRSWQCRQVGILFCKHHGAVSCHTLIHGREDKALQLTGEGEDKSWGAHGWSEGPESGVHSGVSAKVLGQDRERRSSHPRAAWAGAREGIGTHRCHLDLFTDFKYKPDISILCY